VTYSVVVTARARADAIEAFRWKTEQSPQVAARWYAGLQKALAKLSKFPERHPIAEEETQFLGLPIRQMVYGKKPGTYRLLFSIEQNTVVIHYIRHSARGPLEQEGD
jgi:plasmid stabilization system protein ParE